MVSPARERPADTLAAGTDSVAGSSTSIRVPCPISQDVAVEVADADPDRGSFKQCAETLFRVAYYTCQLDRLIGSRRRFCRPVHAMPPRILVRRSSNTQHDHRPRGGNP